MDWDEMNSRLQGLFPDAQKRGTVRGHLLKHDHPERFFVGDDNEVRYTLETLLPPADQQTQGAQPFANDDEIGVQLQEQLLVEQHPTDLSQFEAVLQDSIRMPLDAFSYQKCIQHHGNLAKRLWSCAPCALTYVLAAAIAHKPDPGRTEVPIANWAHTLLNVLATYDQYIQPVEKRLRAFILKDEAEHDVSVAVSESSGPGKARPDKVLVCSKLSMLFSVAKARGKPLEAAWSDHERKLRSGFPDLFYGTIPFLPVFAIAGDLLQWGMLQPSGQIARANKIYHLEDVEERVAAVTAVLRVHSIICSLIARAPPEVQRMSLFASLQRPNETTITLQRGTAVKIISNCDLFFSRYGTNFDVLKAAHNHANSCDALVSSSSVKYHKKRKSGQKKPAYEVVMTRLGYSISDIALLPWLEARKVVLACLRALQHMHAAHPQPIVHCDVRIGNILFGPEPFLSDLELAHMGHWQVPLGMMLKDWQPSRVENDVPGTLSPGGVYNTHSDIFQVGVMLGKHPDLPEDGLALVAVLKSKNVTAAEALAHELLQ